MLNKIEANIMNRPVSPNSILNIAHEEIDDSISITGFREAARIGFEYLQQKLNKTFITVGDGMQEFFNFDVHHPATDNDLLIPLFCLVISLLQHSREELEAIQPGVYNSLFNYVVNQYILKVLC